MQKYITWQIVWQRSTSHGNGRLSILENVGSLAKVSPTKRKPYRAAYVGYVGRVSGCFGKDAQSWAAQACDYTNTRRSVYSSSWLLVPPLHRASHRALNSEKLNSLRLKKKFSREIEPGGMVLCERYQLVARFTPLKSKARVQRVKVIK